MARAVWGLEEVLPWTRHKEDKAFGPGSPTISNETILPLSVLCVVPLDNVLFY